MHAVGSFGTVYVAPERCTLVLVLLRVMELSRVTCLHACASVTMCFLWNGTEPTLLQDSMDFWVPTLPGPVVSVLLRVCAIASSFVPTNRSTLLQRGCHVCNTLHRCCCRLRQGWLRCWSTDEVQVGGNVKGGNGKAVRGHHSLYTPIVVPVHLSPSSANLSSLPRPPPPLRLPLDHPVIDDCSPSGDYFLP